MQSAFWLDIRRSYERDRHTNPIWVDTLLERNYITRTDRGVELQGISGGTVVYRNVLFDVKLPILDRGVNSKMLNNRIEKPDLRATVKQ